MGRYRAWCRYRLQRGQGSRAGGPREGIGGAVIDAMCADAMRCSAWASGDGEACGRLADGGGAATALHIGQSMPLAMVSAWPDSSSTITIFMMPMPVHTDWIDAGLTSEVKTETARNKTNHASARPVMVWVFRSVRIGGLSLREDMRCRHAFVEQYGILSD